MKKWWIYFSMSVSFAQSLGAVAPYWTGTTSAIWGNPANWSTPDVPQNPGDSAIFSNATVPNQPSLNGVSYIVGVVSFASTSPAITISPTGAETLTMNNLSSNATITVSNSATDTMSVGLVLVTPTVASTIANSTLLLSGIVSGSSAFTATGSGTTSLTNSSNSLSGGITVSGGTLRVSSTGALGSAGQVITLSGGTLQAGGVLPLNAAQTLVLTGVGTVDTNTNAVTVANVNTGAISGTGSLSVIGGGSFTIQGTQNTYQGGTNVTGSGTNLSILGDGSLGVSTSALSLGAGTTLTLNGSVTLNADRAITLGGAATIANGSACSILGVIGGAAGSLTKAGGGTLTLSGANTYLGPTTVSGGILQGTTTSLQGTIAISGTAGVVFNQSTAGTYAGSITGASASTSLSLQGGGVYTFSGTSLGSASTVTVSGGSELIVTGSLSGSTMTIDSGSTLSGIGEITVSSSLVNHGNISPGQNFEGTLSVTGSVHFDTAPVGTLVAPLSPTGNGLLFVSGTATLTGGTLAVEPDFSKFLGLSNQYIILQASTVTGVFATLESSNPNLQFTIEYTPTEVLLNLRVVRPFEQFECGNFNECAVARNLDTLNEDGLLTTGLKAVINGLIGQDQETVQNALDQMHPAALSAFAELQTQLGGQFLSLSHRKPSVLCACSEPARVWVEPFGNWLHEKNQGMEIGFQATTRGLAMGCDYQFTPFWTLGVSGSYDTSTLHWNLERGHAYVEGAYAAIYSDFVFGQFYTGFSGYAGKNWMQAARQMQFPTVNAEATSHNDAMNGGIQWTAAYYFGKPLFLFYPYLTADYLYLRNGSFTERGAGALNLKVDAYTSHTLRAETGISWEFTDRNAAKTVCISPLFSIGYVLEWPIERSEYEATFEGESLPFFTRGWVQVWQLLSLRVGLGLTYHCFSIDSQYHAEISPEGGSPFLEQRANFRFSYVF